MFVYPISPEIITYNLAATLALFEPVLTQERQSFLIGEGQNKLENVHLLRWFIELSVPGPSSPNYNGFQLESLWGKDMNTEINHISDFVTFSA